MQFVYPALFHNEDGGYWVEFPDLPGCFTQGDSVNEVLSNAQESLEVYLEATIDNNLNLPKPSKIETIAPIDDGFVSYVSVNVNPVQQSKSVKKTLTIPSWLNDRALKENINFSQVLQEALLSKLL